MIIFPNLFLEVQASKYKVEAKVERGGGGSSFEDYDYGFVTADVTFRPAQARESRYLWMKQVAS
ncbi:MULTISPECIES: hypothetical protein [unclassified Brevibacillus]|uniref:hypothetical protein n=1 Tax=unclassified Brevibacillus TaxID=2684853 RepID=UPI003568610E